MARGEASGAGADIWGSFAATTVGAIVGGGSIIALRPLVGGGGGALTVSGVTAVGAALSGPLCGTATNAPAWGTRFVGLFGVLDAAGAGGEGTNAAGAGGEGAGGEGSAGAGATAACRARTGSTRSVWSGICAAAFRPDAGAAPDIAGSSGPVIQPG